MTNRYDRDRRPIRHVWDQSQRPSTAIVEAVAAVTGREPTELPPLQRSVDVDSLDSLLTAESADGETVQFSFEYDGVGVSIDAAGGLTVWPDGLDDAANDSTSDLDAKLGALLRAAAENGTAVSGGYEVRNDADLPDWEVIVTEVEKPGNR